MCMDVLQSPEPACPDGFIHPGHQAHVATCFGLEGAQLERRALGVTTSRARVHNTPLSRVPNPRGNVSTPGEADTACFTFHGTPSSGGCQVIWISLHFPSVLSHGKIKPREIEQNSFSCYHIIKKSIPSRYRAGYFFAYFKAAPARLFQYLKSNHRLWDSWPSNRLSRFFRLVKPSICRNSTWDASPRP